MRATAMAASVLMAALAACAAQDGEVAGAAAVAPDPSIASAPAAEGVIRSGASIATMSYQYAHPRPVGTAATGASAWVAPPPEPAYVATGPLPPADAPPPPLAAVANRQPAPAATPAAEVERPEAAAPAQAAPGGDLAAGRALFNQWSCGVCHMLADADASGAIGPALDGNGRLTKDSIVRVVTDGQGAMPAFGGQIDEEDIAALADYILAAKR